MNKKILIILMFIFIISLSFVSASENDTFLSVSESNDVISIYNDNASSELIGNSLDSNNILEANEIATKIDISASKQGIIEDGSVLITATLTDMDNNPIANTNIHPFFNNNELGSYSTDANGQFTYNLRQKSGFYYMHFAFKGNDNYAASSSDMLEVAFANTNDLTDLAVRIALSDGVLNLTKDYSGYGSNGVIRRDVNDYNRIIFNNNKLSNGIIINKDLIINGNGHTIDATYSFSPASFFKLRTCTFTLNDIYLLNGHSSDNANPVFQCRDIVTLNFNNVSLFNCTGTEIPLIYQDVAVHNNKIYLNFKNSKFIDNEGYIFPRDLYRSTIEGCTFINNSDIFLINNYLYVDVKSNLFLNCPNIFSKYIGNVMWESGQITGNYWGTNDSSIINSIRPTGADIYINFNSHSYLSIDGNNTFSEDEDFQNYKIYFSGSGASKLPSYETLISYTSLYSTINATTINISSTPTTVRVSPKTYGVETLTVEPNLYVLPINITKSTKLNYNVTVDAPETEYSIPLLITVNVSDVEGNPVTTTANVTIDDDTKLINIDNGVGTLSVNNLIPGTYEITTKVISNMNNYRNTAIYSSTNITNAITVITISCSNTTSLAREDIAFTIKTQNVVGENISSTVYLVEDGVEVGSTITDSEGNAVYYYAPEAGHHTYTVVTHNEGYWKSSESNPVEVDVTSKIPTKLTISSDTDIITDVNQKATINVRLVDENNAPIKNVEIKLIANDAVAGRATTDNNGECEFQFTNSSNQYNIKAVYDGNLTYYDNSSEIITLTISTGGSFFDLSLLINLTEENGELNIVRNFTFNDNLDQDFINGIPVNKNIIINGGDNIVDALNKARIFNITADKVVIDKLNIVNATSQENGGAIVFTGKTLSVSNSKFKNNKYNRTKTLISNSLLGGGAIYSTGVLNISNSIFEDNKVLIYNNVSYNDVSHSGGGAIFAQNDVNIYNSVFDSNIADKVVAVSRDASIFPYGSSLYMIKGNAIIHNSTFKNAFSLYSGGAIAFDNKDNGYFSISDSSIINNTAMLHGGIFVNSNGGKISNTTFENNKASREAGALLVADWESFLITESKFINNTAPSGGAIMISAKYATVEKSFFINNHADNGGAIYYYFDSPIEFKYNIFVNNTADIASGAYYEEDEESRNLGNLNYDYWGNNTPFEGNIFNDAVNKTFEYITLEIIGDNVTYTSIPTTYIIKFNGTNADKLPDFETLIDALAEANVNLDKTSIIVNESGAKVILTSDTVQNITLIVGPEYNVLAYYNINVEQLIKKNYTYNVNISGEEYGSNIIASITVLDENGNKTDINGTLTYTLNNNSREGNIINGIAQIPLGRLDAGEYTLDFIYNSTNLSYNDLLGNKTFTISKTNMTFTLEVNNFTYGNEGIITATPQRGITDGNFTLFIKDILNETVLIQAGKASYTLKNIAAGNYTLIATFNNRNYNPVSLSTNFTVFKSSSKINVSIDDANYGDEIIAFVTGENITGTVTVTVNNKDYPVEIINNAGNVTIDILNVGNYTATVVFDGNQNHTGSDNTCSFEVFKTTVNMTVEISESILGHNTTINVEFDKEFDGMVNITVDGETHVVPIKSGVATLNLSDLTGGEHNVTVLYPGNENFYPDEFNTTFSTKSLPSQIIVKASDIVYGENLTVKATVNPDATGTVEFTVNNVTKRGTVKNGVAEVTFNGLNAGEYEIMAKYLGDNTYISSYNTTTVNVSKAKSYVSIDIGEIKEGENIVFTFTLPEDATGNITIEIIGFNPISMKISDGVVTLSIPPMTGTYTVNVKYAGDDNYLNSSNSTVFVTKNYPSIDIEVSDAFVGDDYIITVTLNSTATGNVLINVDGVDYTKTLNNGKTSLSLKNLTEGVHNITVLYSGDDNFYNANASMSFEAKSLISTINVTAADIVYGNDLVVKATVTAGATGDVEFSVNGITKKATLKNGVASAVFSALNAGSYEVTAKYLGDKEYISSSNTTVVKVSKARSYVLIDVSEIKDGENVVFRFTLPDDATGNVIVEIPGLYTSRNRTINNGVATWTISPLKSGVYTLNVRFNGDNNYLASSNTTTLVSRYPSDIIIEVSESIVGHDTTVGISLPQNATGWVLITVDGVKYNKTLENGKTSVIISKVSKGVHNVDVIYSGDDYYYPSNNSTSFEPKQMNSNINVLASDVKFGEGLVVRAIVNEDATGSVTFTVNGESKVVDVHQGFASATFTDLNAGDYNIRAVYSGNDVYSTSSNTTRAKVLKSNSTILIKVGKIEEGKNVVITFTASNKATGNITVEIPGLYSSRVRTLSNNVNVWTISPLSAGLYQVTVKYDGDNNYYGSFNSTYIDYNRVKTTLDVDVEVSKTKLRLNAKLTAEDGQLITAWVNMTIGDIMYRIPVFNGTGHLDISRPEAGNYSFYAFYAGTRVLINSSNSGNVQVPEIVPILSVPNVTKYYKGSERLYVYLKDNYNDPIVNVTVKITINGVDYTKSTDKDGSTSLAINLDKGTYTVTVAFNGTSVNATINVLSTVNGTDITKIFRNGTQYLATFRDSQGNYLKEGTLVTFNINGVMYERTVNNEGIASLNINLQQGKYIITAMNPVTGEASSNTITVIPRIIENHDLTKYYRNASQYSVKIIGGDGKAVGAGEEVTFNINGVFYTRTTDESGIAKLNINLQPGDYIITASYGECSVSNKIKVLPVLSASNLNKKYGTSSQFIANLVDGQGKAFSGQMIQFNINGVFYNRQTDSFGQARLNINLQPGKYIITSSYDGSSISNTVTVIP